MKIDFINLEDASNKIRTSVANTAVVCSEKEMKKQEASEIWGLFVLDLQAHRIQETIGGCFAEFSLDI